MIRLDDSLYAGKLVLTENPFGVLGSEIPDSGTNGAALLSQFVITEADQNSLYRIHFTSLPATGTFEPFEDSSFVYTAAEGEDSASVTYDWYKDSVYQGSVTVDLITNLTPMSFTAEPSESICDSAEFEFTLDGANVTSFTAEPSESLSDSGMFTFTSTAVMVADPSESLSDSGIFTISTTSVFTGATSESLSDSAEFEFTQDGANVTSFTAEPSESLSDSGLFTLTGTISVVADLSESIGDSEVFDFSTTTSLVPGASESLGDSAEFEFTQDSVNVTSFTAEPSESICDSATELINTLNQYQVELSESLGDSATFTFTTNTHLLGEDSESICDSGSWTLDGTVIQNFNALTSQSIGDSKVFDIDFIPVDTDLNNLRLTILEN